MKLSQQLLHQTHLHLEASYPNEGCGVMLGRDGTVTEVISADNQRNDSARNRYLIDPLVYLKIEREADKRGLQVLGIYHSHPDVAARPSQFDLDHAWPTFAYVIVAVAAGRAGDMTVWFLKEDRSSFDEGELNADENPDPDSAAALHR